MRRILILVSLLLLLTFPVSAMEFTAPEAPGEAQIYMPDEPQTFAEGVWFILRQVTGAVQPAIAEGASVCLALFAVVMLVSVLQGFSGNSKIVLGFVGTLAISVLLFRSTDSLVNLGAETVITLADYGKLLLPVLTSALAAQGGVTASAALYVGTTVFCTVLSAMIAKFLVPLLYVFLSMSIAACAIGENMLGRIRDLSKWLISWGLKIMLYVFTGYISITGVISGTADASAVKAAKLALSGMIPVVGNIIADASETILVSAGVMKNSVGIYGLLAILALVVGPFLKLGVQYLLLKLTAAVSGVFGVKHVSGLIQTFSAAMGLVMAMLGTMCLLMMISIVCFMKGVGA